MFDRVYNHQLDAKNRMRIPAKLRDELGEKYTITCGVGRLFIRIFRSADDRELKEKLSKISMFDAQAQKPLRLLLAYSWDARKRTSRGAYSFPKTSESTRNWKRTWSSSRISTA